MSIFDSNYTYNQTGNVAFKPTPVIPKAYIPAENNCPLSAKTTLTFNGTRIGSSGNMTFLQSAPKRGKSAICEAIMASHLCPSADTFGLKTHNLEGKKILYIDGEQSTGDHWNSWRRVLQRANIRHHYFPEDEENNIPPRIVVHEEDRKYLNLFEYQCHSVLPTIEERKLLVEATLKKGNVGMLILDGMGDFIRDVNRADEVTDFYHWYNSLAQIYGLSVFLTLHVNPKSDKARGHAGSEAYRRCEACLTLDMDPDTKIRKLSVDMARSDDTDTANYFAWDKGKFMFSSCQLDKEFIGDTEGEQLAKLKILAGNFELNKEYSHKDLKDSIMRISSVSEKTAKTRINELLEYDLITKEGKIYKLCTDF